MRSEAGVAGLGGSQAIRVRFEALLCAYGASAVMLLPPISKQLL